MDDSAASDEWANELPPFATLIAGLAQLDDDDADDGDGLSATLEELRMTLAIELEVRGDGRQPTRITGSTPTQWIETTVLPAFHRLSLHVVRMQSDA
jgi:hypothetical protein